MIFSSPPPPFANALAEVLSFQHSWNTAAYTAATCSSSNTSTWLAFTYKPVTEKFVEPVSTRIALSPRETMSTLSCASARSARA